MLKVNRDDASEFNQLSKKELDRAFILATLGLCRWY